MATRKRKNTTNTNNKRKKTGINIDLAVIILFVVSILLFVLIYGEKGAIGEILSPTLGGTVGIIKYIIPIGFMGLAVCIAKDDKNYIFSKLIQYAILISCIAATMSIYQISTHKINIDLDFNDVIEASYDLGVKNIGGGTVGIVIAYPLIKLLGMFGAAIATAGIVVVLCVFTFGLHPSEIMLNLLEELEDRKEERNEEMIARREHRIAKRELARNHPEYERKNARSKNINHNIEEIQSSISDAQIKINLDDNNDEEPQKEKRGIFGRKLRSLEIEEGQKEEFNPDVIDVDIYKNTAQANEAESMKRKAQEDALFTVEEEQKESKTKAVLQLEHTVSIEDENYEYPPVSLLGKNSKKSNKNTAKALTEKAQALQRTLHSFGVSAKVVDYSVGPAITRFELKPAEGVRVSKIANLADDIALNLAAETIRIEAPIPRKTSSWYRNTK